MKIEELHGYIAFIHLKPMEKELREHKLKLAQELFKSGAISLDDMLDVIKLKE